MTAHPYTQRVLALLGDRPPREVLEETPARLEAVLRTLGPEGLRRSYGPGKWDAHHIVVHLADTEVAIGARLRLAVGSEGPHTIQPFDQDRWASRYDAFPADLARTTFGVLRGWNLAFIGTLTSADLARPAVHPERGPEPVARIIELLAGHDLNHLDQLDRIAAGRT